VRLPNEATFFARWRLKLCPIFHQTWLGPGDWWTLVSQSIRREVTDTERANDDSRDHADEIIWGKEFTSRKEICQDLEKRGLLKLLSLGEPEQIVFTFDWYRHSL
jgi:hypothetical protein